jgi:hypothetical protein
MTKFDKISAEQKELNLLINEGISFTFEYMDRKHPFSQPKLIKKTFTIHQPTLAVIDLLSAEAINMVVDEDLISKDPLGEAKKITAAAVDPMARYIAIAILGRDAEIPVNSLSKYPSYKKNEKEINGISSLIKRSLTPAQLREIVTAITQISNIGDFLYSIRLAGESRSTTPNRVEEDED